MTPYLLRPAAVADLRSAYRWYQREREGLGEEFLLEVQEGISLVSNSPRAFPVLHKDTRRALVHRFPYGLFFRIVDSVVIFVACYHLRRDPKSWQRRR